MEGSVDAVWSLRHGQEIEGIITIWATLQSQIPLLKLHPVENTYFHTVFANHMSIKVQLHIKSTQFWKQAELNDGVLLPVPFGFSSQLFISNKAVAVKTLDSTMIVNVHCSGGIVPLQAFQKAPQVVTMPQSPRDRIAALSETMQELKNTVAVSCSLFFFCWDLTRSSIHHM